MKLEGIRVLDLSRFLPGPHLAMMMADHGADVIKAEDPKSGDPARVIGPVQAGHTVYFRNANRGKRSLAIDLKSDAGREAFMRLAETADVVLGDLPPRRGRPLGHRLRGGARTRAAGGLRLHLRLRPVRALPRPPGPRPQRQRARRRRQPQRRWRGQARHGLPAALGHGGLDHGARRHPHGPAAPPDDRARRLPRSRHVRHGGVLDLARGGPRVRRRPRAGPLSRAHARRRRLLPPLPHQGRPLHHARAAAR